MLLIAAGLAVLAAAGGAAADLATNPRQPAPAPEEESL